MQTWRVAAKGAQRKVTHAMQTGHPHGDGRREERESRQGLKDEEEKEKREERERGGVSYLMAGEKKGERGEGFSLKEDFM